jgi:hypothetical protein
VAGNKFRLFSLVTLSSFVILLILTYIVLSYHISSLTPFLPGSIGAQLGFFFAVPLVIIPLCSVVLVNLIIKVYLWIFRHTHRNDYVVAHYPVDRDSVSGREMVSRAVLPVLLAFALGNFFLELCNYIGLVSSTADIGLVFATTIEFLPITAILILPIYISEDIGIIFYKMGESFSATPEVQSIGGYVRDYLKGFTGIVTIFQFGLILVKASLSEGVSIITVLIILFPVGLLGMFGPIQLIFRKKAPFFKERLLKSLKLPRISVEIKPVDTQPYVDYA